MVRPVPLVDEGDQVGRSRGQPGVKILRWIVGTVAVVAWIGLPVALASILTARSERSVQSPPIVSAWLPVGETEPDMDRKVIAVGTLGAAPPLLAPAWTGLVEQVDLRPGEPLRSGEVVAVVSGIPRLALHTARPFHRTLGYDDRGADVAELNAWLRARGLEASEGDRFGAATRRGVRDLRQELHVPEPEADPAPPAPPAGDPGAPPGEGAAPAPPPAPTVDTAGTFDPGWVVYLPRPEVIVSTVNLQVGAPVAPPGSVVAEVEADVASVRLVQPDPSGMVTPPRPPTGAGDAGPGAPAPGADPSGAASGGPPPTAGAPPSGGGSMSGTPVGMVAEGSVLRRNGEVLGPVAPDGTIPDDTLGALLPLFEGQDTVMVDLVEPAPPGARPVPAAALFTGPTGASCVATRAGPGRPVEVTAAFPLTADVDRVVLAGLPDGPLEVEVNASAATRNRCQG